MRIVNRKKTSPRLAAAASALLLLLAALTCVIGLLLVIRPSDAARALMVLMGISLLLDGILNICVAWFCVKIVRNQRPDGIDEEYEELKDE